MLIICLCIKTIATNNKQTKRKQIYKIVVWSFSNGNLRGMLTLQGKVLWNKNKIPPITFLLGWPQFKERICSWEQILSFRRSSLCFGKTIKKDSCMAKKKKKDKKKRDTFIRQLPVCKICLPLKNGSKVFQVYLITLTHFSGRFRGGSGGSVEPSVESKYFIFTGNSQKIWMKWSNWTPSAKLNLLSKYLGSIPAF